MITHYRKIGYINQAFFKVATGGQHRGDLQLSPGHLRFPSGHEIREKVRQEPHPERLFRLLNQTRRNKMQKMRDMRLRMPF